MMPAHNSPAEPLDQVLGTCDAEAAGAYVEILIRAALAAWRAQPRDTRGALIHLGNAVALIARRDDL